MERQCRLCNILNGSITGKENQLIAESNEYFSLASIGALVEGWVLVIPKKHVISMKELYIEKGFINFTNYMIRLIKSQYSSSFIIFEHGPNKCDSNTSCGTDHAHLHILPYQNSLYIDMLDTGLKWGECTTSQISSIVGSDEYLFYSEISSNSEWEDPKGFIHVLAQPVSQYFRRLIANQINRANEYDYKKYSHKGVAIETNNVLSRAIGYR